MKKFLFSLVAVCGFVFFSQDAQAQARRKPQATGGTVSTPNTPPPAPPAPAPAPTPSSSPKVGANGSSATPAGNNTPQGTGQAPSNHNLNNGATTPPNPTPAEIKKPGS